MKLSTTVKALTLALGLGAVAAAQAVPIELFTGQVTKLKFTNYEQVIDNNNNGFIDTGDTIYGVYKVTSIEDLASVNNLNGQLATSEITGSFQFHVVGTSGGNLPLFTNGTGHLDFGMQEGDYINGYVGTGATKDFNVVGVSQAAAITSATNGGLWFKVDNSVFYQGINNTVTTADFNLSTNRNWMNFAQNLTGYDFAAMPYSTTAGEDPLHTYLGTTYGDLNVEAYFASRLFGNTNFGNGATQIPWVYRSEDPFYVFAVPEPGSLALIGLGLLGVAASRRKAKKA